ncbi:hypothetical protein [Tautonia rosea]|uniref:hypothetical protein n=1 Tax=Tautonia rosea TaxID=2728037 RepID=UPI00147527A9|nr:hypothetical protein [Tautonia rosea]
MRLQADDGVDPALLQQMHADPARHQAVAPQDSEMIAPVRAGAKLDPGTWLKAGGYSEQLAGVSGIETVDPSVEVLADAAGHRGATRLVGVEHLVEEDPEGDQGGVV